jgi:hypothetical protein
MRHILFCLILVLFPAGLFANNESLTTTSLKYLDTSNLKSDFVSFDVMSGNTSDWLIRQYTVVLVDGKVLERATAANASRNTAACFKEPSDPQSGYPAFVPEYDYNVLIRDYLEKERLEGKTYHKVKGEKVQILFKSNATRKHYMWYLNYVENLPNSIRPKVVYPLKRHNPFANEEAGVNYEIITGE